MPDLTNYDAQLEKIVQAMENINTILEEQQNNAKGAKSELKSESKGEPIEEKEVVEEKDGE